MKLSTREDVALPIEAVFEAVADLGYFERRALRRGAEVSRTDPEGGPGAGSRWDVEFAFRGKRRQLKAELVELAAPTRLRVTSRAGGLAGDFTVELVALNPRKTRMIVGLEMVPHTLSARLLVQSFKLAKASLSARFAKAVDEFARGIEKGQTGALPAA